MAGAKAGLEAHEAPTAWFRARTHRLIASRWPTIGVFDTVASAADLEAALLLASLTDDRVNETLTRLGRLDRSEWRAGGPGLRSSWLCFVTRPPVVDGSTARRWAPGIAQPKSRPRSPKRFITTPNASPIRPVDFGT
jgi:hypothetical protein